MKPRILFTKEIPIERIAPTLGDSFECSFLKVIKIVPVEPAIEIGDCHHFIFTSKNAFRSIGNITFPRDSKFYVVGDQSEKALVKLGFKPVLKGKNARELAAEITSEVAPTNIMHFCSSKALSTLSDELSKAGFQLIRNVVYKTEPVYPINNETVEGIVFFSPSGVESFFKNNKITTERLFAIGKTTQNALTHFTNREINRSENENLKGLLEIIKQTYEP